MKTGVYPGTFDPITNGHLDIIKRSLRLCDQLYLAIAANPQKKPLFDLHERIDMAHVAVKDIPQVIVEPFDGLLVTYVDRRAAHAIIRGLRATCDFEYELQMAMINRKLHGSIETIFLIPSEEYSYLTSSAIKELASYGANLKGLVPKAVEERLAAYPWNDRP